MADALKAQVELLTGKGDFASIAPGGLEGLLPLEENIRKKTAQTDTDVLKQTLLGNTSDAVTGKYDSEGRFVVGQEPTTKTETKEVKVPYKFVYEQGDPSKYSQNGQNMKVTIYHDGKYVAQSTFFSGKGSMPVNAEKAWKNTHAYKFYKDGKTVKRETTVKGDPKPIYAKDQSGNIITDKSKAGQSGTLPAERLGDGMLDLLGDSRNVEEFTTREATQEDVNAGLASEVGESITEATGNRKAGFDEQGNFLGLSALSEDIQRGNLSRQREADLADVERLSDRYQDVMANYKPAATEGLQGARDLLAEQKDNLTSSGGVIEEPSGSTFGGNVQAATMKAAQVADPITLKAPTSYDPSANVQGGEIGADPLRTKLMSQAESALDQGLTDRERSSIEQASRARQTATGRIFDPSATVQESQAVIEGDRNRLMQNRAFAQGVLGQEANIQNQDLGRGLQAQLANQAATNQARQFGVSAGMGQESQQAGLQQKADLAQAQLDQQANAFGADSAQRTGLANQAQLQQANQFGVGATMDAQRLNEQLRQQGLISYINALGNLARMEDQFMLDPFQALLGRGGGNALQQGQSVFGQAGYGLQSGPQYLNPEAGLGYISNMAANQANMYGAQLAADASRSAGIFGGLGALGGGLLSNAGLFS